MKAETQTARGLLICLAMGIVLLLPAGASGQVSVRSGVAPCPELVSRLEGPQPYRAFAAIRANKCQDALPLLKEMYESGRGVYRDEILLLCAGLWNPEAGSFPLQAARFSQVRGIYLDLLRVGLETPSLADMAAHLAEQWSVGEDLKADLIALLKKATGQGVDRIARAFLPALRSVNTANGGRASTELEEAYAALLNNTPVSQGIEVNKLAAVALGELKSDRSEAIKGLVKGLFLRAGDGGTTFRESLQSILEIGSATVPYLVAAMDSKPGDAKVEYLRTFAVKHSVSQWQWSNGMRIPMVLALLRDRRAAHALLKDIARPIIDPASLPNNLRQDWTITKNKGSPGPGKMGFGFAGTCAHRGGVDRGLLSPALR